MGTKTWKLKTTAAGNTVRGQVIVASRSGSIGGFGEEIGKEIVDELNRIAVDWRPVGERQPVSGDRAEQLAAISVATRLPLMMWRDMQATGAGTRMVSLLADWLGPAMDLEPRFARAYGLAVTAREQARDGRLRNMGDFWDNIAYSMPQLLERPGQAKRAMQVEVRDVAFPKPGKAGRAGRAKNGLAEMRWDLKFAEIPGTAVGTGPKGSLYYPLPLFDPGQPEPWVQLEMMLDDLQVIVDVRATTSAYGLLRAFIRGVEEVVEDFNAELDGRWDDELDEDLLLG